MRSARQRWQYSLRHFSICPFHQPPIPAPADCLCGPSFNQFMLTAFDAKQSANLDLLRSFAVLAVLAAHICQTLRINALTNLARPASAVLTTPPHSRRTRTMCSRPTCSSVTHRTHAGGPFPAAWAPGVLCLGLSLGNSGYPKRCLIRAGSENE